MDERAFSEDGYIKDQDYTGELQYGRWPSNYNGCGWIAAFNLVHALGLPDPAEEVFRGMLDILLYEGRRGTPTVTVARYFRERKIRLRRCYGKAPLFLKLLAEKKVSKGILRYEEGLVPHYITFIRTAEEKYRFLNTVDGLEDFMVTPEEFAEKFISSRFWLRIFVPREEACS